jgi:ketosteroid isomerase-like protein
LSDPTESAESVEAAVEDTKQNVARLQRAYQLWNETRGGSVDHWMDLMSDDVVIHPPGGLDAGSGFFRKYHGKADAFAYFSALADSWEMVHFTPEEFIGDGGRVVVLSRAAFRHLKTGKVADSLKADVFLFRDGVIVEYRDFFDTACAMAAQTEE